MQLDCELFIENYNITFLEDWNKCSWPITINNVISEEWIIKNTEYLEKWKHTRFPYYPLLKTTVKGKLGEILVTEYMRNNGFKVSGRKNTGHDRIIDDIKTEIKISIRLKTEFICNHISLDKDWERLIFLGINAETDEYFPYFITKDNFRNNIGQFNHQQGGITVKNDDYMLLTKPPNVLSFFQKINEWK